jgi:D-serine deaminase-like pyridoxal phosphate-dependent protein
MLSIQRPALLLSETLCRENINTMARRASAAGVSFRPHFKTHQSAETGTWFREAGVTAITVSSVQMAEYFAAHGWDDITIAFPCNLLEINTIRALSGKIRLNLLVDSIFTAGFMARQLTSETGYFIEIDPGYHRSGVDPEDHLTLQAILEAASATQNLRFRGFLTHAGQTYQARGRDEIKEIHESAGTLMLRLKETYRAAFPDLILSCGDTPSCSLFEPFPGTDEIRPGNFVFYDLMQAAIGSCTVKQIAVALICPVVSVYPQRSEAVLHGGTIHLSKEMLRENDQIHFGMAVRFTGSGWDTDDRLGWITSLSQEHGILKLNPGVSLHPGDRVAILPVHSCITAHQMRSYLKTDGTLIRTLNS